MNGTSYSNYAINNNFILDTDTFIEKKSANAKFRFVFIYKGEKFGVWFDYKNSKIFVSYDFPPDNIYEFSTTLDDHTENTLFIKSAKKFDVWRIFIDSYQQGLVRFENIKIKNICHDLIKSILIH